MFDIAQLALNPPLEAGAARAGDLAAETFAAGVVDAIPRFAPNMVDAEIRPVETLALTRAAIARDAVAPGRGPPPRPLRGEPARDVFLIPATEICAQRHPPITLLRRGVLGDFTLRDPFENGFWSFHSHSPSPPSSKAGRVPRVQAPGRPLAPAR